MVSIKNVEDIEGTNLQKTMDNLKNVEKKVLVGEKEGATNFIMRLFTIGSNGFTEYHTHEWEHEVFILKGEGIIKTKNKNYEVKKGDCIYIEPNEKHQFLNPQERDLSFICVIPVVN